MNTNELQNEIARLRRENAEILDMLYSLNHTPSAREREELKYRKNNVRIIELNIILNQGEQS